MYPVEVAADWIQFWDNHPELHAELRRSWHFTRARLAATKVPWRSVTGPISTTIQVLSDIGWEPWHPDQWREPPPSPTAWFYSCGASPFPLFAAIEATIETRLAATAARHYLGKGFEEGVDYTVMRRLMRKADRKGDAATAGLLRTIATAAIWPQQRRYDCDLVCTPLCPRCGREPESAKHRYWRCAANDDIQDSAIIESNFLAHEANLQADSCPVRCLRGLQPNAEINLATEAPCDDDFHIVGEGARAGSWNYGTFYVNGSGGAFGSDPRLRRCGIGIVKMRFFSFTNYTVELGL